MFDLIATFLCAFLVAGFWGGLLSTYNLIEGVLRPHPYASRGWWHFWLGATVFYWGMFAILMTIGIARLVK